MEIYIRFYIFCSMCRPYISDLLILNLYKWKSIIQQSMSIKNIPKGKDVKMKIQLMHSIFLCQQSLLRLQVQLTNTKYEKFPYLWALDLDVCTKIWIKLFVEVDSYCIKQICTWCLFQIKISTFLQNGKISRGKTYLIRNWETSERRQVQGSFK